MPVIAPEEPQLALARGAALASASAPRYDTSTIGLAYSQDPDGTTVYPLALADDATTFLGHADATHGHRRHRVGLRRRAGTQQAVPVSGQLAGRHLRSGNDGTDHRIGGQCPADRGSGLGRHGGASGRCGAASRVAGCAARRAAAAAQDGPCPRPGGTTTCAHRHGTAEGTARPAAAASGGAQRSARPGRATTRTGPTAARCASAGDTAPSHPVAATDCSATPLLQPGSEGAAVWRSAGPRRPRWRAWARRW